MRDFISEEKTGFIRVLGAFCTSGDSLLLGSYFSKAKRI